MKRTQKRELDPNPQPIGKLKGVAFLGVVKLLRSRRDDAMTMLRPELHRYLTETVRPSGWYPESDHVELLRAGAKLYPGSPDRALEMMGEFAARTHCEIYKEILVGHGSPSRTFALWATQHDTGELRRIRELPNRMRFELVGFGDTSRENCLVSASSRSRSVSAAISGSLAREGSTDSTSRSRVIRASSRQTARRSYPSSTARPAISKAAGAFSAATAVIASSSKSRPTRPRTVDTSSAPIVLPVNAMT